MASKNNIFASPSATLVKSNILSASFFNLNLVGRIGTISSIDEYQRLDSNYYIQYTGVKKYAAKMCKYYQAQDSNGNYVGPIGDCYATIFIGYFSSIFEIIDAVGADIPEAGISVANDFNGNFRNRVYYASSEYVNVWLTSCSSTDNYMSVTKPSYMDLVSGYYLDGRSSPLFKKIIPSQDKTINIFYYQRNIHESIPGLTSIDCRSFTVDLFKNKPAYLPIKQPVLGTLWIDDIEIKDKIKNLETSVDEYNFSGFFPENVEILFSNWYQLYELAMNQPLSDLTGVMAISSETNEISVSLKILGADNNFWNNGNVVQNVGIDINHPLFLVNNQRAYDWHIKPVQNGIGDLIMNSPLLEDIGIALQVSKYAYDTSTGQPRVANLGHLIEKTAFLMGYRPEPDGTFSDEAEKARVRRIISSKQQIDKNKIGVNNFGPGGMVLRRIINRFKGKQVVCDECVIVQDIPQLIAEFEDRINLALGLQESGAIEINNDAGTARYNNQLELMIELVNMVKSNQEMLRAALTSSLVTQGQTSEIIGGLGLPSLTKTLPIKIDGKNTQLPYKGISPHRSISQEIATCTYNVGLVLGQLL